jgi:hypothetical protein
MNSRIWLIVLCLFARVAIAAPADHFVIQIVDDQTGRGVPLVELRTTAAINYYTDSAGVCAINEPELMGHKVWFEISSHGYEYPADGLGSRGAALDVVAGQSTKLRIKRINIAERLYRITGEGIYRDSVLAGRAIPIRQPLLNGGVVGQDSVMACVYRGKIHWFWGDTLRQAYPLGHFQTAGATSNLPGDGGLDPKVGIDLDYFVNKEGFSRPMVPLKEPGMVWIAGLLTVKDDSGTERMLAHFSRMKSLGQCLERGMILYNDQTDVFERFKPIPLDAPLGPDGQAARVTSGGKEYFYFTVPYPTIRVLADWQHVTDVTSYEGYTCLTEGSRFDETSPKLARDPSGKVEFSWKKNTPPLTPDQLAKLIESGQIKRDDCPMRLQDADTGKPVNLHAGSVNWNEFRKKWILIGHENGGSTSNLGEVWYSQAPAPEGPWIKAKKIVTHNKMDFYNVTQHAFFDQEGGRYVCFEGTYTNMFSGNPCQTPRYEYNQIMYRLDLADERLKMQ